MTSARDIDVIGAGVLGLWQALTLARAGHRVRLIEASATPFALSQSRWAGAMLAPYCEAEGAEPIVREMGIEALALWRALYPGLVNAGTLVVAPPRDRPELFRFARLAPGHEQIDADRIASLEPDLAGRFSTALYFPDEAHMATPAAMSFLLDTARASSVDVHLGTTWNPGDSGQRTVVDCRGLAARDELPSLRGVRGERLLVRVHDIALRRSVRLLHPRHPIYVVPWQDGIHLVGATVIESEDHSVMTVRSALELLGAAYALHPAFGEAEILELGAGVRPSFPDNIPRVIVRDRNVLVNGAYRHGFLMAPVLAAAVANYLASGTVRHGIMGVE
jgi:glycine oxidase